MKIKYLIKSLKITFVVLFAVFALFQSSSAQSTNFTFQGKLTDTGNPANGVYDLQFKLYDLPTGGTLLGTLTRDDVMVTSGIFTVQLDYDSPVFTSGAGRFLEISVRSGVSTSAFTTIAPRQKLTAAPYAVQTLKATDADNLGGQPANLFLRGGADQQYFGGTLKIQPGATLNVLGNLFGSGANLTNLNANNVSSGTLSDARLSSNVSLLNAYNIFTGGVQFNSPPLGSGEFLTNLQAGNLSGTIVDARLSSNIPRLNAGNTFSAANNNFAGRISANSLSVGGGIPITKILTGSATLDFRDQVFQEVLTINVPGARPGDAVMLGIPNNLFPTRTAGAFGTVVTEPYLFQAYVAANDTVAVTKMTNLYPGGDNAYPNTNPNACINSTDPIDFPCTNVPPALFRVVVFSFAP